MEREIEISTIKDLFVILQEVPLIDLRYKNQKLLKKYKSRDKKNHFLPCSKRIIPDNTITFTELLSDLKNQNLAFKECIVVLEKIDINRLNQAQSAMHQELLIPENGHTLSKLSVNTKSKDGSNSDKLISEKSPAYKEGTEDQCEKNYDLYEFDEPDSVSSAEQNLKKRKKVNKRKCKATMKKSKICNTYDKTIQEILQKVMKKVNKDKLEIKNVISVQNVTCHKPINPTTEDDIPEVNSKITCSNNHQREIKNCTSVQKATLHKSINATTEDNIHEVDSEVDNTDSNSHHNIEINENVLEGNKENGTCEVQNDNSDIFSSLYSPIKASSRIHIISDITLDTIDKWFSDDKHSQPDANSTLLPNKKCNPWRFSENLKRNPYYLFIKKNALPSLQQEMVIDHSFLEKIEERFVKRAPKQLKVCLNKSAEIEELFCDMVNKENVPNLDIFEDFVTDQPKLLLQENLAIKKRKRNILGPIQLNENNITKAKDAHKNNVEETQVPFDDEILESENTEKLNDHMDMPLQNNPSNEPINLDPKIFEDEEPNINFNENSKIYIPKTRKKRRMLDNVDELHKDKYKKEMTKTEEAELERWAAMFNSLCKDIENHKLEVE